MDRSRPPDTRGRTLAAHLTLVAAITLGALAPFLAGWHTLAPVASLGGVEAWASPSHLVGQGARSLVDSFAGSTAGDDAAGAVTVAFFGLFIFLVLRLARPVRDRDSRSLVAAWGAALLLLALSMPYLLPWYAAWFAPFLGVFADDVFLWAGALVTAVLGVTLIPADPFHGRTSVAVMDGVHYGAASVLLLVLVVLAFRVLNRGRGASGVLEPLPTTTAPGTP